MSSGVGRKQALRCILSDAIIELCRREAFYITELRIEGTICVVSDRSSALIIQITEQVGEKSTSDTEMVDNRQTPQSVYTVADDAAIPLEDMRDGQNLSEELDKEDFASEEAQIHQMVIKAGLVERMEGKYNCPFCPKRYRFKHSLKDHINKHTGNRPHQCKHCSLRFIHLSSLCAHVRRRHSQVRVANFRCDICQDVFATEQFLKQHHTWKHKEGRPKPSVRGAKQDPNDPASATFHGPGGIGSNESIIRWSDLAASQDLQQLFWDGGLKGRSGMAHMIGGGAGANSSGAVGGANLDGSGSNNNSSSNNNSGQDDLEDPNACFQQQIKLEPGGPGSVGGTPGGTRPSHHTSLQKNLLGSGGVGSSLSPTFNFQQQQQHNSFNRQSSASAFGFPFGTSTPSSFGSFAGFSPGQGPNAGWAGGMMSPMGVPGAPNSGGTGDGSFLRRAGNGKFQCPHCDKSYNFKHTLKEHINKHLGRRPNVCKHCGDSFIHLASLCAHIKRAHDEHMPTDFVCRICNEKLMNYQSLKQHYTWRHREARMLIEANAQTLAAIGPNGSPGDLERNGGVAINAATAAHLWQQQLISPQQQQQQQQSQPPPQQQQQPDLPTTPVPASSQVVDAHGLQQQQLLLGSVSKDEFAPGGNGGGAGGGNGGGPKNPVLKELDFLQGFESFAQSIGVNMGLDSHHLHHHHHHHTPSSHHHQQQQQQQQAHHHHHQQQQQPPHHHHSTPKPSDALGQSMMLKDHP